MKANRPGISPIGVLLLICLAMAVSATSCTSCKNDSSPSNEQKSPTPTPTPTPNRIAKQTPTPQSTPESRNRAELSPEINRRGELQRANEYEFCAILYSFYGLAYEYGRRTDVEKCSIQIAKNIKDVERDSGKTFPESIKNVFIALLVVGCREGNVGNPRRSYSEIELKICRFSQAKPTEGPSPPIGRCPKDISFALCAAIAKQSIEKSVRKEGPLKNCSVGEATEVLQKCVELTKRRPSP